jgi:hypothetical protein
MGSYSLFSPSGLPVQGGARFPLTTRGELKSWAAPPFYSPKEKPNLIEMSAGERR